MSFRGRIAIPIENKIEEILRQDLNQFADIVESGGFISSINFILSVKHGMTDEVKTFQKKYKSYIGLTYDEISLETAEKIYEEYEELLSKE